MYTVNLRRIKDLPELSKEIRDFCNVITARNVMDRPLPEGVEHAIDLDPGERPLFRPLYNLSIKELAALREYLKQALKNG